MTATALRVQANDGLTAAQQDALTRLAALLRVEWGMHDRCGPHIYVSSGHWPYVVEIAGQPDTWADQSGFSYQRIDNDLDIQALAGAAEAALLAYESGDAEWISTAEATLRNAASYLLP